MTQREEQLITKGKTEGLTAGEADELKSILHKEAFEDFTEGKLGPLALVLIGGSISLIVDAFLVRRTQGDTASI